MEATSILARWHELYFLLASTAGVLVGLLFIVMSLHLDKIKDLSDANIRFALDASRNNTYHLLTAFLEASLVLTPQPLALLGLEVFALSLYGLRLPLGITYTYWKKDIAFGARNRFPTGTIATVASSYLFGMVGGLALIRHLEWGLYFLTGSLLMLLVRSVLNAWRLLFVRKSADKNESN